MSSSINKARRTAYLTSRTLGDVQAVKSGRIWQRIFNRWIGRQTNKAMKKIWM